LDIRPDALNVIVRALDADGFLIHMHAMGDRAVRVGLDAIEHAIQANGVRERRHQLAHIGVANPTISGDLANWESLPISADLVPCRRSRSRADRGRAWPRTLAVDFADGKHRSRRRTDHSEQ